MEQTYKSQLNYLSSLTLQHLFVRDCVFVDFDYL